ncbi:hypothetical protein ACIP8U_00595 [Streptomyces pseudovenezuelae]|uniref:hypothetical protein n=1 Tax=Streptomyces pseudovenezuelae TaxID=67350 RepID=UPI00381500B2
MTHTHPDIPLGHIIPSHQTFGWCLHCPDRSLAEELAAWQTRELRRLLDAPASSGGVSPATDQTAPACSDPIECSHEAALGEAQQQARRLGLMVDEYGAGASALTDKLKRIRDIARRLAAHAVGFQDVLDDSDRDPWARTVGADIAALVEVLDAPATAVLPASVDRADALREAAEDEVDRLSQWLWDNCAEDERSGLLADDPRRVAAVALRWPELRRVAAETRNTTETDGRPRRGDQFEAWLKAQRDGFGWQGANDRKLYDALDGLLDQYRLHADMGTSLDGHVCEARVVGDCECLETPQTTTDRAGES